MREVLPNVLEYGTSQRPPPPAVGPARRARLAPFALFGGCAAAAGGCVWCAQLDQGSPPLFIAGAVVFGLASVVLPVVVAIQQRP